MQLCFTVILCTGAHVGRGFSLHCLPEDHTVLWEVSITTMLEPVLVGTPNRKHLSIVWGPFSEVAGHKHVHYSELPLYFSHCHVLPSCDPLMWTLIILCYLFFTEEVNPRSCVSLRQGCGTRWALIGSVSTSIVRLAPSGQGQSLRPPPPRSDHTPQPPTPP